MLNIFSINKQDSNPNKINNPTRGNKEKRSHKSRRIDKPRFKKPHEQRFEQPSSHH